MVFLRKVLEERWLLYIGLAALAIGLPLSRSLVSIAPGILIGAWFFDGLYRQDFTSKWQLFIKDKRAWSISLIFLVYLLWGFLAENDSQAVKLILDKLPLLFIPLTLSGLPLKRQKDMHTLLYLHIAALVLSTCLSTISWIQSPQMGEIRDHVLFVNHIRLSLMIVLAVVLVWAMPRLLSNRIVKVILTVWFLVFVYYFQLATGFVLLCVWSVIWALYAIRQKGIMRMAGFLVLALLMVGAGMTWKIMESQFSKPQVGTLKEFTQGGKRYYHDRDNLQTENGHYVWHHICKDELIPAWNERSEMDIPDHADLGDLKVGRLIRYMTSKGLPKDAEGVRQLTDEDIAAIEQGSTSVVEPHSSGILARLEAICYEVDAYRYGGDPSWSSVTVKLEYWKAGVHILKENPWLGTGVGDVRDEFHAYFADQDRLAQEAWDKTHNQYLTWWLTFGIPMGTVVLILFLAPITWARGIGNTSLVFCYLIFLMSFLTEDTMENQLGLNLFLLYFVLLGKAESTSS
ncbi:MAG: O-antigen ligase family protein [Flavobacteriales bacterium]|nr:O-antigen ligase family protein [Flavobacteriales bacterium]